MITPQDNHLYAFPWKEDLKGYNRHTLRRDFQAGLTVAVFAIPQSMAYAMLAGLPPVYGLYSAIVLSTVAALFGSSSFSNTGPTNSSALLTATALAPLAATPHLLNALFTLTLMVGVIRLLLGLFRMGRLLRLVPEPAFLGFTVGAGVLIAFGQLHHFFGLAKPGSSHFLGRAGNIAIALPTAHLPSLLIGGSCLVLMILFNRHARRFPVALTIILIATIVTYLLGDAAGIVRVLDIAPVISTIPQWKIPTPLDPDWIRMLFPAAAAIALIGLIEASAIAQRLALRHGKSVNYSQEFLGQGLSHVVGAFFQCFPGSGSFSRSALIEQCGGITRIANIFFGLLTLIIVALVPGLLNHIPIPSLAGLLVYIGIQLIDTQQIKRVFATSRVDSIIMVTTFAVTLFWKIEYGIFTGIVVAMFLFLNRASTLHLSELIPRDDRQFDEQEYLPGIPHTQSEVVAVTVFGELFFGVASELRAQLNEVLQEQAPRHLILRVRRAYSIDFSCWNAIFEFARVYAQGGGRLYLCGVRPDFEKIVRQAHMEEVLPNEQVFSQEQGVFEATHKALAQIASRDLDPTRLSAPWRSYFSNLATNGAALNP